MVREEKMNATKVQQPKMIDKLTRWSLALGILIWFMDLNTVYPLASVACEWGWFPFTIAGIPGLVFVEAVITLIFLLLMGWMVYLPWRKWRAFQSESPSHNPHMLKDTEKDRRSLIYFITMLLNSFFFLFMIAFFVPIMALNACVKG